MLELDFAFFNMRQSNRQGLANRKPFLDRLAPWLFSPRVERLIYFGRLGLKGCNLNLPLGEGNWGTLNQDNRGLMLARTSAILEDYALPRMGVDRRLKSVFTAEEHQLSLMFGDCFISILAAVLIDQAVSRHDIKKLVFVGDIPHIWPLILTVSAHQIPISLQNLYPKRYEIMVHRLLYEEGLAVSNSWISPQSWNKGDLVLSVEPHHNRIRLASPHIFHINLDDERSGAAPELEQVLQEAGLDPQMYNLAPILESCLLAQAGKPDHNGESNYLDMEVMSPDVYREMIDTGDHLGMWEPFLDKVG
ncbi:MAG: hypothetical protein ABRQ24_12000 [Syntrophomonadaceae bacterium]